MAIRINYVVSSWHGPRTKTKSYFERYGWHAVQKNLECLSKARNGLSQVTVIAPADDRWPSDYEAYLDSLAEVGGVPVKVIGRENKGYSYESWRRAYLDDPSFDYYIFVEDDYCPVHDDFDSILVELLADRPVYLCGLLHEGFCGADVAAISNGIASSESMGKASGLGPFRDQTHFSNCLTRAGVGIADWRERYRSPFYRDYHGSLEMIEFAEGRSEYLIVPVQMLFVPTFGNESLARFSF